MKIAVITDQHFGVRGDSKILLDQQEKFHRDVFMKTLDERNIDTVFDLGDTFDRRKHIDFNTLNRVKKFYFDELKKRDIKVHSILGNHTTYYKNINDINSPELVLGEYDNISLYKNEPVELNMDGCLIMLSPWISDSNRQSTFKAFKSTKAQILMGHFEIQGFEMQKGVLSDHGLDKKVFSKFDSVYSGHFHHPSNHSNIRYLGAPYEMIWSDYDCKRGFHIFDTETREMEFIENPYKLFHKIEYDDEDMTIEDVDSLDFNALEGTFIKIVVINKTNPHVFDVFMERMHQCKAADVKVVEDSSTLESVNDEELIDEAQDTPTILNAYVEQIETKSDKKRVKGILTDLYDKAMNL